MSQQEVLSAPHPDLNARSSDSGLRKGAGSRRAALSRPSQASPKRRRGGPFASQQVLLFLIPSNHHIHLSIFGKEQRTGTNS